MLAGATLAGFQTSVTQIPSFRASTDMVRVDVFVRRGGRPVTGLQPADFEVSDRGIVQQVVDLSFERLPIDVTVAFDLSASVRGETLARLKEAVDQLESQLRPADQLKLVNFSMRVRRVTDNAGTRASSAIAAGAAGGATSLFDTVATLLAAPAPSDRRQLIIVFSDGIDTVSITEPETVLRVASSTTPTLAFVLPVTLIPTSSTSFGSATARTPAAVLSSSGGTGGRVADTAIPAIYQQLALETGGTVIRTRGNDVRAVFSRLLDDFRSSYVLYYTPTAVERSGFHPIDVRVKRQGTFEVRARRGYVAK
jgi:VWFA-related protein